ncbi:MAG: hypothetical protein R3F38_01010 [Gammaproteobacteria bacterium]
MSDKPKTTLKRVKTGAFERRFSMAKAGFVAGTMLAAQSAGNLFTRKEDRAGRQSQILSKQAHYLAEEIGKLKGSIVKIGQMMALYGEHFLPKEVTEALHTPGRRQLPPWRNTIHAELRTTGDTRLAELEIEESPGLRLYRSGTQGRYQDHRRTDLSEDPVPAWPKRWTAT